MSHIAKTAAILEVRSAFGRDVKYIRNLGYEHIVVSDAFDEVLKILKKLTLDARKINLLEDDIKGHFDLVLAPAVF